MSKKLLLPLIGLITLTVIVVVFISIQNKKTVSPLGENRPTPTQSKSAPKKEYIDPSGFKFKYPTGVFIKEKEFEDNSVYSWIELTSPKIPGGIEINVADSSFTNLDDLLADKKNLRIKPIKLADVDGRQYELKNQLITVALDQGVLFTFTVDYQKNEDYWLSVNKTIVDSFVFQLPESTDNSTGSSDTSSQEDVIFEGEEVIE